eukprot:g1454.t1
MSHSAPLLLRSDRDRGEDSFPANRRRRQSTIMFVQEKLTKLKALLVPPRIRVEEEERAMTPTECFWDLLFVLPLQQFFTLNVIDAPTFGLYVLLYMALFNCWIGEAMYNTRFDTDDVLSRFMTAVQMVGVAGMGSGITKGAIADDHTFQLFYVLVRLVLIFKYLRAARSIPAARKLITGLMAGFGSALVLWVVAAFLPRSARLTCCAVGILIEYATPFLLFPWMISVNPGHIFERFASFTVLTLAGNLFSVMMEMPPMGEVSGWSMRPILITFFSVMVPLTMMLLYTEFIGVDIAGFEEQYTSKWRVYSYLYLHSVFTGAIELASVGLSHAECGDKWDSRECMSRNSATLFFGGLGFANLLMGMLQFIGREMHDAPEELLALRFAFAVTLACGELILDHLGVGCTCLECLAFAGVINALQVLVSYVRWGVVAKDVKTGLRGSFPWSGEGQEDDHAAMAERAVAAAEADWKAGQEQRTALPY